MCVCASNKDMAPLAQTLPDTWEGSYEPPEPPPPGYGPVHDISLASIELLYLPMQIIS